MRKRTNSNIPAAIVALPRSYLALMAVFPLRPIRNGAEYDHAAKIVHKLALREGTLDAGEDAYLEVLEGIVERYDLENYPIRIDELSPARALRK